MTIRNNCLEPKQSWSWSEMGRCDSYLPSMHHIIHFLILYQKNRAMIFLLRHLQLQLQLIYILYTYILVPENKSNSRLASSHSPASHISSLHHAMATSTYSLSPAHCPVANCDLATYSCLKFLPIVVQLDFDFHSCIPSGIFVVSTLW